MTRWSISYVIYYTSQKIKEYKGVLLQFFIELDVSVFLGVKSVLKMEVTEQIKRFHQFFEDVYQGVLLENVRTGAKSIVIDFTELLKFDPELGDILLEQPEEVIKAAELSIEQFDLPAEVKDFKLRLENLPPSQKIMIRNIRSEHIGKLVVVEGIVRQKSDVRPQVTAAKFECPSCGNIISVLQLDSQFKEPSRCGCGRKGKFKLINKELIDAQGIVLEESPENIEGGEQPKRMNIFLKGDLVSPLSERKSSPGSKINIVGIIKEVPIILKSGGKSTRFDLLIEANSLTAMEETFYEIDISEKEEKQIKDIAKDKNVYKRIINSIAPSIYGYEKIKEALILQLMGGVPKVRSDGAISRGDMHVLLVGDPGAGKSQLLKRVGVIAPKGRYVTGRGVSGAGLTASVVKDEFLKGWSLEAGALVLASNGICAIDEMDKMSPEDRSAMHEALEQQTVSISKANIQATLLARTTVLAAANPKFGRFDPYGVIGEQIDLPPTLINRFDLIFPIKDLPDKEKDTMMASHILSLHQEPDKIVPEIPTKLLKKYIAYAKQRFKPKLTTAAMEEIREYYLRMRASGSTEGSVKTIPISPRQLEALVRLAEASAKVRLSNRVTKRDAVRGIEQLEYCLMQVGFDKETGKIDIDRITTGITASQRNVIIIIKDIINDLEKTIGKTIPIEDVVKEAKEQKIEEDKVEEVIERLRRSGDVFEPRRGFISRL
ncbi:AAA family ATPase [Candidatus Woesearchaeota archaeon]|nr:AAA family ATPase [Candidatus Woesearchaeota archaeon]|tara:strand:+ start:1331 stop:3481 length:2151 start_codon:yes stop_codon:yes gene_type:complete